MPEFLIFSVSEFLCGYICQHQAVASGVISSDTAAALVIYSSISIGISISFTTIISVVLYI